MSKAPIPTRSSIRANLGVSFLTWRRHLQRDLSPYGITLKQQHVLAQLDQTEYLYPSDIAEMLFCDRPTATVILDNLEKQGWIRRDRESENRKFIRISITPAGRQKLAEIKAVQRSTFDPLAEFSDEELRQFDRLLKKLRNNLEVIEDISDKEEG